MARIITSIEVDYLRDEKRNGQLPSHNASGISTAFPSSSLCCSSIPSFYCFLVAGKTGESTVLRPLLLRRMFQLNATKAVGGRGGGTNFRIFARRQAGETTEARRVIATFILAAHREAKNAIRALNSLLRGAHGKSVFRAGTLFSSEEAISTELAVHSVSYPLPSVALSLRLRLLRCT